ncbi:hypothetical protein KAU45_00885 [bacterium]|nr:hypothetical protein [bacterium]
MRNCVPIVYDERTRVSGGWLRGLQVPRLFPDAGLDARRPLVRYRHAGVGLRGGPLPRG